MRYFRKIQDIKKRKQYKKTEMLQRVFKILILYFKNKSFKLNVSERRSISFSKSCYFTQIKNFCIMTGRSRGVYRLFKVSRIVINELSAKGYFFGLKKAS